MSTSGSFVGGPLHLLLPTATRRRASSPRALDTASTGELFEQSALLQVEMTRVERHVGFRAKVKFAT